MTRRVLVTGAAGFVGAALCLRLLRDGHEVQAVVRPGSDLWRLKDASFHGLKALSIASVDLAKREAVDELISRLRPEWVFHLAAHGAYSSQTDLGRMILSNILGTMQLVDSCLRVGFRALVNAGSSSEYGFTDHAPSEDEEAHPNSHYAVTKLAATLYCRAVARRDLAPITTLRLYSVYGPFEEPDRFLPTLALRGMDGGLPPLVAPDTARDFVHVDDVVEAFLTAAQRAADDPGAVFNVGTSRQLTIREAVEIARRALSVEALPSFGTMPNRAWDASVWVADTAKIRHQLGWEPNVAFEAGFRKLVAWLREDPERLALYRERSTPLREKA